MKTTKQRKMEKRLKRGVLEQGETNTGQPNTSKINPRCKWYRGRK